MGTPHEDTGYDAGASLAIALIGLVFIAAVFTLPWMFDPAPYDQVRVVTLPANARVVAQPSVARGQPVQPPAAPKQGLYPSLADLRTPSGAVDV